MENASQALLIAAGVLIAILVLSLGIYLAYVFSEYSANTQNQIDQNTIAQFNDKFMKYDGRTDLTIQDVITVKNYALENNEKDGGYNKDTNNANENNEYIDVYYGSQIIWRSTSLNDDEKLLKEKMSNTYKCVVKVDSKSGRVNKITFTEN